MSESPIVTNCCLSCRLFVTAMAVSLGFASCNAEPTQFKLLSDGNGQRSTGLQLVVLQTDAGGRGGAGEALEPLPEEQTAVTAIQDAGLPAVVVRYGPMRFVETTAAGAAKLSGLAGLETLNICLKEVSDEELAQVQKLPPVNGLLVFSSQVTDEGLRHLSGLTKLKYLWIEQANITAAGLEHLKDLTTLESLNVRFKPLAGGLKHLEQMTKLKSLNIPGTKVTDDDLAHLTKLTALESMNIGASPITDAGLEHLLKLKNLKTLHLRQTSTTDTGLERLQSLKSLEELNLVLCRGITDEGVETLQNALPDCEIRR